MSERKVVMVRAGRSVGVGAWCGCCLCPSVCRLYLLVLLGSTGISQVPELLCCIEEVEDGFAEGDVAEEVGGRGGRRFGRRLTRCCRAESYSEQFKRTCSRVLSLLQEQRGDRNESNLARWALRIEAFVRSRQRSEAWPLERPT
jgi:hypothetical protein